MASQLKESRNDGGMNIAICQIDHQNWIKRRSTVIEDLSGDTSFPKLLSSRLEELHYEGNEMDHNDGKEIGCWVVPTSSVSLDCQAFSSQRQGFRRRAFCHTELFTDIKKLENLFEHNFGIQL